MTSPRAQASLGTSPDPSVPFDPYEAGRRAVAMLKEAEGGSLSRDEAAERLGLNLSDLYARLKSRKVVAWTDTDGRVRFPVWQFGDNGMLPGVQECLAALGKMDEWAVMRFFLTPDSSMGFKSALSFLREGNIASAREMADRSAPHP